MSKGLGKYILYFDYFDKSLIVLSAASATISIASFATLIGVPVGIASDEKKTSDAEKKFLIPVDLLKN